MSKEYDLKNKYNKLSKELDLVNNQISNYKPLNLIADDIVEEIEEYIQDLSPIFAKIIKILDGKLVFENGKVFYYKDRTSAFPFSFNNAEEVVEKQASTINSGLEKIVKKGADEQTLKAIGKSLVTIYNIYENIKDMEDIVVNNFVKKDELLKQRKSLQEELNQLRLELNFANSKYKDLKDKVLLTNPCISVEPSDDFTFNIGYNDDSFSILNWKPLEKILVVQNQSFKESIAFIKSLVMQFLYSVGSLNGKILYFSQADDDELDNFFFKINYDLNNKAFLNDIDPSTLNKRDYMDKSYKALYDLLTERQKLLSLNNIEDIFEYNKKFPKDKKEYVLVIIEQYPEGFSNLGSLAKINSAPKYGIFVVFVWKNKNIEQTYEDYNLLKLNDIKNPLTLTARGEEYEYEGINYTIPSYDRENSSSLHSQIKKFIKESNKTIVSFEDIGFNDKQADSRKIKDSIYIPVGKCENEIFGIKFASGNQGEDGIVGGLITGGTGSGKTSIIESLVFNGAMKYSPDDLNFYLIDFKDGVSNQKYLKTAIIPHVKLITEKSKKEDAVIILSLLNKERIRRNKLFNKESVKNIDTYNSRHPEKHMPRIIIIIDEANEMLEVGDYTNTETSTLIDRMVGLINTINAQGRSTGIHLMMAAQKFNDGLKKATTLLGGKYCFKSDDKTISETLGDARDYSSIVRKECSNKQGVCVSMVAGSSDYKTVRVAYLGDNEEKYSTMIRQRWNDYEAKPPIVIGDDSIVNFKDYAKNHLVNNSLDEACIGLDYCDGSPVKIPFNRSNTSLGVMGDSKNEPNSDILTSITMYAAKRKAQILLVDESNNEMIKEMFYNTNNIKFFNKDNYLEALYLFKKIYDTRKENKNKEDMVPVFLIINELQNISAFTDDKSLDNEDVDEYELFDNLIIDDDLTASDNSSISSDGYIDIRQVRKNAEEEIKGSESFFYLLEKINNFNNMFIAASFSNIAIIPEDYRRLVRNFKSKVINDPFEKDNEGFTENVSKTTLRSCSKKLAIAVSNSNDNNHGESSDSISKVRYFRYQKNKETWQALQKEIKDEIK